MILLTEKQRNRLRAAASFTLSEDRVKVHAAQAEKIAKGINEVLAELHKENPFAFSTEVVYADDGIKFMTPYEKKFNKFR